MDVLSTIGWTYLALSGALIWVIVLLLPWRPWSVTEVLQAEEGLSLEDLSDVTVLIPARNEAERIQTALAGLRQQGGGLSVLLVDDQSTDETSSRAREAGLDNLTILSGAPPPAGWSGKLWALEQGFHHIRTPLTLMIDADIYLEKGTVASLKKAMRVRKADFLSLMAALRMTAFWERLLIPAFIYFFRLLYPFRLSNSKRFVRIAAAAGGCIILRTEILERLGGFAPIRGSLIDDCALAGRVKSMGFSTWIGLTRSVRSLRSYERLPDIWNMVARTAFAQLHYSTLLLILCTGMMAASFLFPLAALASQDTLASSISGVALGAMILSYLPILSFYKLPYRWAFALPAIGLLFLAMTWTSAFRHWCGKGAEWKGRSYTAVDR